MIVPLFLALLGAPGDPAPDPDPGVEITAARRPLDLLDDRAAAGTVLLPADLDDPGETLPAVLDQQAGLRVVRLGGPAAFSTLSIRGSSGDQVLVVLDGIPMDSAAGGAADLSRLPLGNLERIEVYRGASPLRFGASAIGGVLSLATRRARGRDLAATLSTGAFGERGLRLFAGERRAGWDAALGLDYAGWEGDFPYRNDQGTRFDPSDDRAVRRRNDHADQVNLLARGGVRLAPGWRAEALDWFFWRDQGLPGLGQFETRAAGFRAAESHTAVRLLGEDLGGRADWTTDLSLRWTRSRVEDPDDEIGLSRGGALLEAWAPALRSHAAAGLFPWWDVQAAAGYRWERVVAPGGAAVRHRADGGVETGFHVAGAALSLVPSVRVEWLGSRDRGPPADRIAWSGRAALVSEPVPGLRLSLSGGRAVRAPSLYELYGDSGRALGNPDLRPETAWSLDGGVVWSADPLLPRGWRLRLEAAAFLSTVDELIQFVQTAQNTAVAENVDRARLWGVETGARVDLLRHLRLAGNWSFLDPRNTGRVAARRGRDLPGRPASKWYLRAEGYAGDLPGLRDLSLYVDAEWIAGSFLDHANLVATAARFHLGLGVSLRLLRPDVTFAAAGENLTDDRGLDLAGWPVPGRSWHLLVTWRLL